jgi:hypothetical protein
VDNPWTLVTNAFDPGFQIQMKADTAGLLSVRYLTKNWHLYYLVNSLPDKELRVTLTGPTGRKVRVCNPNDGTITEMAVPGEVTVGGFNSVILLD